MTPDFDSCIPLLPQVHTESNKSTQRLNGLFSLSQKQRFANLTRKFKQKHKSHKDQKIDRFGGVTQVTINVT